MNSEEKQAMATYVTALCEAFGRKQSKAMLTAYEMGLDGLAAEQIKQACQAALRQNRQFMPSPGELRELGLGGEQSLESMVNAAWQCLNRAISKFGYTKSVNFRDALINATVRHLGGWERVCGMPSEEFEKWFRRDFEKTYLQFLREGCSRDLQAPLVGAVERESGHWHGRLIPGSGKTYQLAPPAEVESDYQPAVKSLPAPERKQRALPPVELKRT